MATLPLLTKVEPYFLLVAQSRVEAGKAGKYPFRYTMTYVHPDGKQLAIISDLLEQGKVKMHVSKVYSLEQARCATSEAAHEVMGVLH